MANPNPNLATRFGPGGTPGPGRPALPPELKAISEMTKDEVKRLFAKHLRSTRPELEEIQADRKARSVDAWLASGILRGIELGDFNRLSFMLDRMIGKIPVDAEEAASGWADVLRVLTDSGISMDQIVGHLSSRKAV